MASAPICDYCGEELNAGEAFEGIWLCLPCLDWLRRLWGKL